MQFDKQFVRKITYPMANVIFRQTGRRPSKSGHMRVINDAIKTTFDDYAALVDHLWDKLVSFTDGGDPIELHPSVT